jgi:hypothetical protein
MRVKKPAMRWHAREMEVSTEYGMVLLSRRQETGASRATATATGEGQQGGVQRDGDSSLFSSSLGCCARLPHSAEERCCRERTKGGVVEDVAKRRSAAVVEMGGVGPVIDYTSETSSDRFHTARETSFHHHRKNGLPSSSQPANDSLSLGPAPHAPSMS